MIQRTAQGVTVTLDTDAWPRSTTIKVDGCAGQTRLFGTAQARALYWALGEVLAADPCPDDRPRQEERTRSQARPGMDEPPLGFTAEAMRRVFPHIAVGDEALQQAIEKAYQDAVHSGTGTIKVDADGRIENIASSELFAPPESTVDENER